jgi:hypothetical protein
LVFTPSQAGQRPATAFAGDDGHFEATTERPGDGLLPGDYQVAIRPVPIPETGAADDPKGLAASARNLPARYGDPATSGLTISIQAGERSRKWHVDLKE